MAGMAVKINRILRSEMLLWVIFRTGVQLPPAPPKHANLNSEMGSDLHVFIYTILIAARTSRAGLDEKSVSSTTLPQAIFSLRRLFYKNHWCAHSTSVSFIEKGHVAPLPPACKIRPQCFGLLPTFFGDSITLPAETMKI